MALKFFNEINEKQEVIEQKLKELEAKLSNTSAPDQIQPEVSAVNTSTLRTKNFKTDDRKFNVVVFGIDESSNGTPRASCIKKDMEERLQLTNNDISFHSIRDCFRLGKYNPNRSKPRPILVKLAWAFDADIVLYNRSKVPNGILIKPDMNPEERKIEAALLSER